MKLYVGNLSFETTENDLQDLFEQHGQVGEVALMMDRMTGKSRGFAFVTMNEKAEAEAAISALNGKEFNGRALSVNEARPREERPRPFGGGQALVRGQSSVDPKSIVAAGFEIFEAGSALDSIMNSEKAIELEGTIMSVLPGTMFRVALANEHLVLAHISGKMRKRFIRLTIGDRVKLQMSPYDIDKARIVYRL